MIGKLQNDFHDLQGQIHQIKEETEKNNKIKKEVFGRGTSFSFVGNDNKQLELELEDLQN